VSPPGLHRLLVFLPARRSLKEAGGRGSFSAATVASYGGIDAALQACAAGDAPLSLMPKAGAVDLLFDVSDVFTTRVDAPRMSESRLRQAMPGLVEERLLSEAADCHIAFAPDATSAGPSEAPLRIAVAAIDRVTLTRALDAAAEAGLRVRGAASALYSIPAPTGDTMSIRLDRGRGLARTGEHAGFAFDLEGEAPAALALAVRQLGVKRLQVYGRDASHLLLFAPQLGVEVIDLKRPFDAASLSGAVELLQERYAAGGRLGLPTLAALTGSRLFKPVLGWVAVWLLILVVGVNAYGWKLDSEAKALRESMTIAFRSAFPGESPIEVVPQTLRHLRELRARAGQSSPDDFTVLNAQAAQLLASAPVGSLAGIEYRDTALTLKFKPAVANDAGLKNALRAQAQQMGLTMRFDSDNAARLAPSQP
jgi:general secretion pathway protein L